MMTIAVSLGSCNWLQLICRRAETGNWVSGNAHGAGWSRRLKQPAVHRRSFLESSLHHQREICFYPPRELSKRKRKRENSLREVLQKRTHLSVKQSLFSWHPHSGIASIRRVMLVGVPTAERCAQFAVCDRWVSCLEGVARAAGSILAVLLASEAWPVRSLWCR